MRCKKGDLAIVVREFEGCEGNLGKLVLVVGNPRQTKNWGIVWKIKPIADSGWWVIPQTGDKLTGTPKYCQDYLAYLHSDEWLFPIKAEPTAITATESTHTPKLENPGGHFKFPHLWPGQTPPGGTTGMDGLLLGLVSLCKAVGGFFEPVAFAAEFDEDTAVQEAVQNGGGQRGVAKEFVPICSPIPMWRSIWRACCAG